jgi:hypothetical protein
MTELPSQSEPVLVRIVPGKDGVVTVKIEKDRRWGLTIASLIFGAIMIIFGFALAQKTFDQRPATYAVAHAIDAAKNADLPLSAAELHYLNSWQNVPTYPPPPKGKESDRIAADAALAAIDATGVQDNTALAIGFGFAIAIAGLTVIVSGVLALIK